MSIDLYIDFWGYVLRDVSSFFLFIIAFFFLRSRLFSIKFTPLNRFLSCFLVILSAASEIIDVLTDWDIPFLIFFLRTDLFIVIMFLNSMSSNAFFSKVLLLANPFKDFMLFISFFFSLRSAFLLVKDFSPFSCFCCARSSNFSGSSAFRTLSCRFYFGGRKNKIMRF